VAKAKGHLKGKQPKLNHRQEAHLVTLLETREYTTAELADLFSVGRSTVYRAVERERALKASAPRSRNREVGAAPCLPEPVGNAPAGTVHPFSEEGPVAPLAVRTPGTRRALLIVSL
jgi:transposase